MEKQRVRNTGCLYLESIVNTHAGSVLLAVDNPFWDATLEIFFVLTNTVKTKNISRVESQRGLDYVD